MSEQAAFRRYIKLIELRQNVRFGYHPTRTDLLSEWFMEEEACLKNRCNCVRRKVFTREVELLIEAIADDLVPENWRRVCLQKAYRPLNALRCIAQSRSHVEHHFKLKRELLLIADYSFHTRHNSEN